MKFSVMEEASGHIGPIEMKNLLLAVSIVSKFIDLHLAISQSKNSS